MKRNLLLATLLLLSYFVNAKSGNTGNLTNGLKKTAISNTTAPSPEAAEQLFIENQGQITDQYGNLRKDIDIKLEGRNVQVFIGDGQLHYQWSQSNSSIAQLRNSSMEDVFENLKMVGENEQHKKIEVYRMDVKLVGANTDAELVMEEETEYYENYYLPQCPNGAVAKSYKKITYKNMYPNIDWVIYIEGGESGAESGNGFKYDFVVHPGGNPRDIKLSYAGATELALKDGVLEAMTPFGSTKEDAPYSYRLTNEKEKGKKQNIASAYRLEGDVLSFDIAPYEGTLIIDPNISLEWSTYYGGSGDEANLLRASISGSFDWKFYPSAIATDISGNVYIAGGTNSSSNIASTGAFQNTIAGNGDGYIVKFSSKGDRLWASYYGGTNSDGISDIACDGNSFYIAATTLSSGLGTSGTYQQNNGGTIDGLLAKFSQSGSRIWASYIGGSDTDIINTVTCDKNGNVYIGGSTNSTSGITSTGAHQAIFGGKPVYPSPLGDGIIAKFNSSGQRLWATYYGGDSLDHVVDLACDTAGNLYAVGHTASNNKIATSGAHQQNYGGNVIGQNGGDGDGFLVKFNSSGTRLWATYYGGDSTDIVNAVTCDRSGNVYIGGMSNSPYVANVISTPGAFIQTTLTTVGTASGFVANFNNNGTRQWGTYLAWATYVNGLQTDREGNLFVGAMTLKGNNSANPVITTSTAHQATVAGNFDATLLQFSPAGTHLYGTYFGGADVEFSTNIAFTETGRIFLSGFTKSTSGIATTGAYQSSYAGQTNGGNIGDAFLTSFRTDTTVFIRQPYTDTLFCAGDSIHVPYGVNYNFRSNNSFTLQLSDDTGAFTNAINIGSLSATDSGTIHGKLPYTLPAGKGYRIRIVASNAQRTSYDNGVDIRIKPIAGNFSATGNVPICLGDSLKLQGSTDSSGVTWLWTGPQSFSSTTEDTTIANVTMAMAGDYTLKAGFEGCFATDTVHVVVKPLPIKPVASSSTPQLCEGMTLNLSASGSSQGATYSWTGPGSFTSALASTSRPNVIASWSGNYIATAMLNGCPARDTVSITIFATPATPTAGSNSPVCEGGEIKLTATNVTGASYEWDGPNGFSATTQNPTRQQVQLNDAGVYNVLARVNGCASAKGSVTVAVNTGPKVLIYPNPGDTICPGWDVTFVAIPQNAGSSPTYAWYKNSSNTGGTGVSYKTSGIADGDSFYVQMTAGSACNTPISSKPLRMTVLPVHTPPTISISAEPGAHVWPYVPVTFKAKAGNSGAHPGYQWRRNGADIPNANDSIWVSSDLKTGDTICCVVTSNFLCAVPREVMSNCLVMNVDVGVNRIDNDKRINIYPNPSDGNFIIEMPSKGSIYISNLQGQHIGSYELRQGKNHISLPAGMAEGVYMGKIMTENGTSVVRMMVR